MLQTIAAAVRRNHLSLLVTAGLLSLGPMALAEDHGDHGAPSGAASVGAISVSGAFARASVTPTGAVYLTIANAGDAPDWLVAAESPVAARADLHDMSEVDGVMRMESLADGVEVPAGATVALAPGNMHVMLMGLTAPLVEGETLPLTLRFEQAGELALTVPILAPGAGAGAHEGMDH